MPKASVGIDGLMQAWLQALSRPLICIFIDDAASIHERLYLLSICLHLELQLWSVDFTLAASSSEHTERLSSLAV